MNAVAHARLTTAVVVAVAGMAGGHLLNPHAPAASPARGIAFYGLMLLAGAWRGWREARVRAEDAAPAGAAPADAGPAHAGPAPGAYRRAAAWRAGAYAAGAVLLSALAYVLVHGA